MVAKSLLLPSLVVHAEIVNENGDLRFGMHVREPWPADALLPTVDLLSYMCRVKV